jgi:hypothetical protein
MKRIHLLRTELSPQQLSPLFAALTERDLRFGWLELAAERVMPAGPLDGALRGVRYGGGEVVARKALRGPVVLADLLREHFRGAAVVFVEGAGNSSAVELATAARLDRLDDERWRLVGEEGSVDLATAELADRFRSPRPVARGRRRGRPAAAATGER